MAATRCSCFRFAWPFSCCPVGLQRRVLRLLGVLSKLLHSAQGIVGGLVAGPGVQFGTERLMKVQTSCRYAITCVSFTTSSWSNAPTTPQRRGIEVNILVHESHAMLRVTLRRLHIG